MTLRVQAIKPQLARAALGMEIGDGALTLACLRETLSGIRLVSSESYPFDPERREDPVPEIRRYLDRNGLQRAAVSLAIPSIWSLTKYLDIPAPGRDSLRGIMQFEIERHIPFGVEEVYWDYQVLMKRGTQYRVVLAAVPRETVNPILEFLRKIPLEPRAIHLAPFCRMNAVGYGGCGGTGWRDLAKFAGASRLFSAGEDVTVSLCMGSGEAELGVLVGDACVDLNTLSYDPGHPEPFTDDLSSALGRSLSALAIGKIDRLLIWGPGFDAPGLVSALEDRLRVKATLINPVSGIARDANVANPQGIVAPAGACLAELGFGGMTLNLLPHRGRAGLRRVGPWVSRVALAVVLFLGIALLASGFIHEQRSLWMIEDRLRANEPEVATVEKLMGKQRELEKDLTVLQGIGAQSVRMLDLLAELANVMPSEAWITHLDYLEQEKKGPVPGDLALSGLAVSSSRLIALLEDSPLFEQVEFVGPITKREGMEGYKIKAAVVKPGLAAPAAEKTRQP